MNGMRWEIPFTQQLRVTDSKPCEDHYPLSTDAGSW